MAEPFHHFQLITLAAATNMRIAEYAKAELLLGAKWLNFSAGGFKYSLSSFACVWIETN